MRRFVWLSLILAQLALVVRDLHVWHSYPRVSSTGTANQHFNCTRKNNTSVAGSFCEELMPLDTSQYQGIIYTGTNVSKKRLAIVIPFIEGQVKLLKFQLFCVWEQYPPCFCFADSRQVDLILFFSGSIKLGENTPFFEFLRKTDFTSFSWRHCFGDIHLMTAGLTYAHDTHPEGTCNMFYQIFPTLGNKYLYFQIIEPDVTPFRKDVAWLEEILSMSYDHNDFWVKGSVSACPSGTAWIDYHINGNALYKLGDTGFLEYLQRVKLRYARKRRGITFPGCSGTFYGGYDVSIFQYLYSSTCIEEWEYIQSVLHHFSYDTTILNYCKFPLLVEEIQLKYPKAVMVHSKWFALKRKHYSTFNCNREHTMCHSSKACPPKPSITYYKL